MEIVLGSLLGTARAVRHHRARRGPHRRRCHFERPAAERAAAHGGGHRGRRLVCPVVDILRVGQGPARRDDEVADPGEDWSICPGRLLVRPLSPDIRGDRLRHQRRGDDRPSARPACSPGIAGTRFRCLSDRGRHRAGVDPGRGPGPGGQMVDDDRPPGVHPGAGADPGLGGPGPGVVPGRSPCPRRGAATRRRCQR